MEDQEKATPKRKRGKRMRRKGDHIRIRKSLDMTLYRYLIIRKIDDDSLNTFEKICKADPNINSMSNGFKNLIEQCLYDGKTIMSTKVPVPNGDRYFRVYCIPLKVRNQFKAYCEERSISMQKMLLLPMGEINHGERTFKRTKMKTMG